MECQKHEHEENPTGKLQIHFWFVLSQARDSSEQGLPLNPGLSKNKQKSSNQCEVPEQELKVPENTVGNGLEDNHKEKDATRDIHLEPRQNHCHCTHMRTPSSKNVETKQNLARCGSTCLELLVTLSAKSSALESISFWPDMLSAQGTLMKK